jgi:predicted phosphodiesterase
MKRLSRPGCIVILACAVSLAGCYSFVGKYGVPFDPGRDVEFGKLVIDSGSNRPPDSGLPETARDAELQMVEADGGFRDRCLDSPTALRFVWLSDVHMRQREVKLFNNAISRTLDNVIDTFEHDQTQEDFHWAVFLSLIDAINKLNRESPLDFMMHTGDGIDSGTIKELYQFIYLTDQLDIPWFNAVGNHDAAIFGNYEARLGYTKDSGVDFFFVGHNENFFVMNGLERRISGFGPRLLPVPDQGGHDPSRVERAGKSVPSTCYHGFDLCPGCDSYRHCKEVPVKAMGGYYSFDVRNKGVPVRVIVLNTARSDSWGEGAEKKDLMGPQREWLKETLKTRDQRLVLLFMHHRPAEIDDETLAVLKENGSRMVVFSGHTHKNGRQRFETSSHDIFYELNTGSILEYPQMGRLMELRGPFESRPGGPSDYCLLSKAFWTSDFKEIKAGASPDEVENEAETYMRGEKQRLSLECREDQARDWSKEPGLAAQCGHWGAYKDYLNNKKMPPWGKPQPMKEALKEINVIVPIR